ncbi:MAG: cytochrome d ubiquinol oxidase subunit II [Thermoleophilia bacterium]|nr:cytochrome d ubiquinol oxidase subunit II [Thermoleophilia bacterium]
MSLADVPVSLMLLGIAAYIVLGGADFGSAFWSFTARGKLNREIREHTHRSMAPVWEANHVWLIFVLVVCWTAYPEVFGSIFSTLWIPLLLACLGIIMRAVSYVVGGVAEQRWVVVLSAVSSFIAPFALGTVIGAIVSGRVPVGNAQGDLFSSWLNPTSIMIGLVAVTVCAYLAAIYLAADAKRNGLDDLSEAFRKRGLLSGVIAGVIAAAGLLVLHNDAAMIYDGLDSGDGLVAVIVSAVLGILTIGLLWRRSYELARFCAAGAVVAVVAGWGFAQSPDILPGLSIDAAAAADNVLIGLLVSIAVGLMILIPSLALLYGLVLGGRFDPGGGWAGGEGVTKGAMSTLLPPGRRKVVIVLAIAGIGSAMTFISSGGAVLYVGVALVMAALAIGFVMLAVTLVTTATQD